MRLSLSTGTVATAAVIASCTWPTTSADSCPWSELSRVGGFFVSSEMVACAKKSAVSLNVSSMPSRQDIDKLCAAEECKTALTSLIQLEPADCELMTGVNLRKVVETIAGQCGLSLPANFTSNNSNATKTKSDARGGIRGSGTTQALVLGIVSVVIGVACGL